ncbi:MAG: endonuclease/exonuclease/phosphatase family protein [Ignavibacteriales bacterium]|nr:endonuclease/exonuclease/phosphatase family protein [Ignavibacteriales bacterium]
MALLLAILLSLPFPAFPQSVQVPPRSAANLLLCSWNIKWFKDTGRDLEKLARVIANFDICGIIELQSDIVLEALAAELEKQTGEKWTYIQSDHTGHSAYIEQFAFIWRDSKVRIASGHVGNISDFQDTFRHEPYIASFRAGNFDFRFLLLHTRWTTEPQRAKEVEEIAKRFQFFQGLTKEKDLILAGDFNYSHGSGKMQPIKGLPNIRNLIPLGTKTTFKSTSEGFASWYDHIFIDSEATKEATGKGNAYDLSEGLGYTSSLDARKEISDHLPVWAEFRIDGEDDD